MIVWELATYAVRFALVGVLVPGLIVAAWMVREAVVETLRDGHTGV